MKKYNYVLTIRLSTDDLSRIEDIRTRTGHKTMNGAIRVALKENTQYQELHSKLAKIFSPAFELDQKKFKELNQEYGFIQRNSY